MTFQSDLEELKGEELADYGFARVRDLAFDAVQDLWRRRLTEGMTQKDIGERLDCDKGWVSRKLRGPGNWTLKTFGSLVEAMNGDVHIVVKAAEDRVTPHCNYDAYAEMREICLNSGEMVPDNLPPSILIAGSIDKNQNPSGQLRWHKISYASATKANPAPSRSAAPRIEIKEKAS